uniref:GED domain-containing protein n=1 Tax=Panagrolaimus davidi TaxID=227884 RepID=A0A914QLX0_9BILA
MKSEYDAKLKQLGDPIDDEEKKIVMEKIIHEFVTEFINSIDGIFDNVETSKEVGGALLYNVFFKSFAREIKQINALSGLEEKEILMAQKNVQGATHDIEPNQKVFEALVKKQIILLLAPSLKCVDIFHGELVRIVEQCGTNTKLQYDMKRFPFLFQRIKDEITSFLKDRIPATKSHIEQDINNHRSYINTKHPDFKAAKIFDKKDSNELLKIIIACVVKKNVPQLLNVLPAFLKKDPKEFLNIDIGTLINKDAKELLNFNIESILKKDPNNVSDSDDDFFDVDTSVSPVQSQQSNGNRQKEVTDKQKKKLTAEQKKGVKYTQYLITAYFNIVLKSVQDMVPKTCMNFLVNHLKENLSPWLSRKLRQIQESEDLLCESENMDQQRTEAIEMLDRLNKANDVLNEIHA